MSEFKFACPVCGQHITADSSAAGSQLSCPTCFRKIVVPQAPTSSDRKFILSAAEASKPRPTALAAAAPSAIPSAPARRVPAGLVVALALVCAAGATTVYLLRGQIFKGNSTPPDIAADTAAEDTATPPTESTVTSATNAVTWTLDLAAAAYPDGTAAGKIRDRDFLCGRAILDGGTLTLRHGHTSSTDLGLNIFLPTRQAEELNGRSVTITADHPGAPWVVLRWKDGDASESETFKGGYALKLEFGSLKGGRLPGKIYLCLPDASKSRVAGTFRAEIKKPKPQTPKVTAR